MNGPLPRLGTTLIETLIGIVLTTLLVAIAGASTRRVLSLQSRTASIDSRRTALADALHTLSRHSAALEPALADLHAARDTVLELMHPAGMTTVCRTHGDTLVVTTGADSMPWNATLPRAITADDALRVWHDAEARWIPRRVLAVGAATGQCGDSSLAWPDHAAQRLVLDSGTTGMRPGVVVRLLMRERWSLLRGSDGSWSLALATWDATRNRFTTPQPLLSPLASPSAPSGPGFAVRAEDAQGRVLADSALTSTRAIVITLRMTPTAGRRALTESVRIDVGAH